MAQPLDIALAGDVMLGRLVNESLRAHGTERPWERVRPMLKRADVVFMNLECAVCGDVAPMWEPERKTFHFRMDPAHVATLAASEADAVQLANNHVLDHDVDGLRETLDVLDREGVPHAGAGRTLGDARAPAIVEAPDGLKVALVAAADHMVEWAAGPGSPGIFLVDPGSQESADAVADAIDDARTAGADVVVVGLHWGPNMRRVPPREFREFAHAVVDAGADVVWGTSAHLFQGVEFYRDRAILYDTGDFLDDYHIDPHERNDRSFLFTARVDEDGRVPEVRLDPITIEGMATRPSTEEEAAWSVARMRELCAEFGTEVRRTSDGWVVRAAHPGQKRRPSVA